MPSALVLGSDGFIAQNLIEYLKTEKYEVFEDDLYDLRRLENCDAAFRLLEKPVDFCFNMASHNGGIGYNRKKPWEVFFDNTMIGVNVLAAAANSKKVGKLITPVTSCGYPDWTEDLDEMSYMLSSPEVNVACHGYAKRNVQLACDFYTKQNPGKMKCITVCPNTVIGPGDCLKLEKTKVGMAVIKKLCDAKRDNAPWVEFWGTGEPLREFTYVEDTCRYMLLAAQHYEQSFEPLNIGTKKNLISIKKYVELVRAAVGYEGEIRWDLTKPDGQACKSLAYNKFRAFLEGKGVPYSFLTLEESVKRTILWYQSL